MQNLIESAVVKDRGEGSIKESIYDINVAYERVSRKSVSIQMEEFK